MITLEKLIDLSSDPNISDEIQDEIDEFIERIEEEMIQFLLDDIYSNYDIDLNDYDN